MTEDEKILTDLVLHGQFIVLVDASGEITHIPLSEVIYCDGPGEEDGPWAEGWEERSGR